MPSPTAEENKLAYPLGCVVSVKKDKLDHFQASFTKKMTNRFGEVTSHTYPSGDPMLTFFAYGRRAELRYNMRSPERYLDIVTDVDAVNEWRAAVLATAGKKVARSPKT